MVDSSRIGAVFVHLALIFGAAVIVAPLWFAFVASTMPGDVLMSRTLPLLPGNRLIENYSTVLGSGLADAGMPPLWRMLVNSAVMALGVATAKISISILSAFAIAYFRFPLRMTAFWLIFATLMLPVEVRIVPTYQVVANFGLLDSEAGLILPLIASATATFLFRQVFMTIPDELMEAARMDGAGPLRFFAYILAPLSITNIAALFIILFVYGWNQYLWPLLVITDPERAPIVAGIQRMAQVTDSAPIWHLAMAAAMLALAPPAVIIVLMQRLFVAGLIESEK
ncbi:MAG: sn-glycerol-3-phosphate ABC transporter permease UgpE [Roseiarcus sp.]